MIFVLFKIYFIHFILFWVFVFIVVKIEEGKWKDLFNYTNFIASIIPIVNSICLGLIYIELFKLYIYRPYIKERLNNFLNNKI